MNPFDDFPKKNEVGWLDEDEVDVWREKWEPIILQKIELADELEEKLAGKQNVIDCLEGCLEGLEVLVSDGEGKWIVKTTK